MNDRGSRSGRLTWDAFRSTYVDPGVPASIKISADLEVRVHVGAGGSALGFTAPRSATGELPPSPLRQIAISQERGARRAQVRVETSERALYRDFFFFALAVVDICETRKVDVEVGLKEAVESWRSLLQAATRMSEEQEIGLIGELIVLERLIKGGGPRMFDAWTGPRREPHDFRLSKRELEVKTTRSVKRVHTIHQVTQLEPSPGHKLYLVSVQVEPAGASPGRSLPEHVDDVVAALGAGSGSAKELLQTLRERCGFVNDDRGLYTERYRLRSKIAIVPVDEACPHVTTAGLSKAVPRELIGRIADVRYTIDISGLGFEDGSAGFKKILPF